MGIDSHDLLMVHGSTYQLLDPTTAPSELLDQVRVDTANRCLAVDTALGTIAVEVYRDVNPSGGGELVQADFFPPLDSIADRGPEDNLPAAYIYPFTILPDGALYDITVRAPREAVEAEWAESSTLIMGNRLAEFRRAYPDVAAAIPEGVIAITAGVRTKPMLAVAARIENGEPLTRALQVTGAGVRYREKLASGFEPSGRHPDTAVSVINSRITRSEDKSEADYQRLVFEAHDGSQKTAGEAGGSRGLVEVIVMQVDEVEYSGFTYPMPKSGLLGPDDRSESATRQASGDEAHPQARQRIEASARGIRNLRAIAAFRFALAGVRNELTAGNEPDVP